jgi:predicted RNase H-like nuclease (RuvC/YqgF family)
MGRKNRNCDKEFSDMQRLKAENKALKRQLSKVRKQIARMEIERVERENLLEEEERRVREVSKEKLTKELEEKWKCKSCEVDVMRLKIYSRLDGIFYFRKCDTCGNRTKSKEYHDEVEGIK